MYELRFQNGTASAGVLSRSGATPASLAERLRPYPWLAARIAAAEPIHGPAAKSGVAYRARHASGEGWVALPHSFAFVDPLFATGLAWSLLGVERVAAVLTEGDAGDWGVYERLLQAEASHVGHLLRAAYACLGDFAPFWEVARGYFVAASYQETCQRLLAPDEAPEGTTLAGNGSLPGWQWAGFLGADDRAIEALFATLDECSGSRAALAAAVDAVCQRRDVAGFGVRRNAYPVELETLRRRGHLLGLDPGEVQRRLPRLFSPESFAAARVREAAAR